MRRFSALLVLCMSATANVALADQMGPVPTKWMSADGRFAIVRKEGFAAHPMLTLMDLRGKPKPIWTTRCPQAFGPVEVHFSADGRAVVFEDEWGHSGYDVSLAFLGPSGKVVKTYRLEDFVPGSEILKYIHTISNILWLTEGLTWVRQEQSQLAIVTNGGSLRLFDMATGVRILPMPEVARKVRAEAITRLRPGLSIPNRQEEAIRQLTALRDKASAPKIMKLMWARKPDDQIYIGRSLTELLGDDFAPEIERQVRKGGTDSDAWFGLFTDGPRSRAAMRRLYEWKPKVVTSAGAKYFDTVTPDEVRRHPGWLRSSEVGVAYGALRALEPGLRPTDQPMLEKALTHPDGGVANYVLSTLIKLRPRGLRQTLTRLAEGRRKRPFVVAKLELARMGDKRWQADILRVLAHPPKRTDNSPADYLTYLGETCELLVQLKLPGSVEALRSCRKGLTMWSLPTADGALAGLGDADGLRRTRDRAAHGDSFFRVMAMPWLAVAKDTASLPMLRVALKSEDPEIVKAAREAIKSLSGR